jgi:hypothetical protein
MNAAIDRRAFLAGSLALAAGGCAGVGTETVPVAVDRLGTFEHLPGAAGFVIAAPHGTADGGSLAVAKAIRSRTGAAGVFVTGFWDSSTRVRINVNRATEQTMGANSQVLEQRPSAVAAQVNARYTALVREAARGPVRWFFEIHSNSYPNYQGSVEVSTLGISQFDARAFKERFYSARRHHVPSQAPQLDIRVAPADPVWFSYRGSSSIAEHSERGFLIESPSRILRDAAWGPRYAAALADVIAATV